MQFFYRFRRTQIRQLNLIYYKVLPAAGRARLRKFHQLRNETRRPRSKAENLYV